MSLEALFKRGKNKLQLQWKAYDHLASLKSNNVIERVVIQWIPGHSIMSGNELADKYAKEIAQNGETGVSSRERNKRPSPKTSDCFQTIRLPINLRSKEERNN